MPTPSFEVPLLASNREPVGPDPGEGPIGELGVDRAGFKLTAVIERDRYCCNTIRKNQGHWLSVESDIQDFGSVDGQVDLVSDDPPSQPSRSRVRAPRGGRCGTDKGGVPASTAPLSILDLISACFSPGIVDHSVIRKDCWRVRVVWCSETLTFN